MGGKSKSTQATTNQQSTANIVNKGDYAGAGDVTIDESTHSIDDSGNTNNSINDSGNTDNSMEFEDSFNTDNSVVTEYEDSFNTDNSVENDGEYSGNNGNITLSDSGAIDAAKDVARYALSNNEFALESAFNFGSDALKENGRVAKSAFELGGDALDEVQTVATSAMDSLRRFGSDAIESVSDQAVGFSDNLESMLGSSQRSNQAVLENAAKSNTDDKALMADLARSTSLAGQDLVAKSSERMTLYMAVALGVGFIAIVMFGRKN